MKRRAAGKAAKPRVCARCEGLMSSERPVYLVLDDVGGIVGPYHAGCAERIALERKKDPTVRKLPGGFYGRRIGPPREETLPW